MGDDRATEQGKVWRVEAQVQADGALTAESLRAMHRAMQQSAQSSATDQPAQDVGVLQQRINWLSVALGRPVSLASSVAGAGGLMEEVLQQARAAMATMRDGKVVLPPRPRSDPPNAFWGVPTAMGDGGTVVAPTELRPPPEHAGKPWHWVQGDGEDPTVAEWHGAEWTFVGDNNGYRPHDVPEFRYLGPCEPPREPATPPVTADAEGIAGLERELRSVNSYAGRLAETNRALRAQIERLTAENDCLRDDNAAADRQQEGLTVTALNDCARSADVLVEVARLRAWLSWMSVSSGDAVLALRGDAAPEMGR